MYSAAYVLSSDFQIGFQLLLYAGKREFLKSETGGLNFRFPQRLGLALHLEFFLTLVIKPSKDAIAQYLILCVT